jgi:dihydrofolate reductase
LWIGSVDHPALGTSRAGDGTRIPSHCEEIDMRRLVVSNIVSLDGFYTGPNNDPMVLPMDDAFDAYNVERLRAADTLLLGHTTFDMFRGFWPTVGDNPEFTPAEREISRLENEIDKVVVANREVDTEPWPNTTVVRVAEVHERITELKRADGDDILVFGSHALWRDLLAHGFVDELHLMVASVLVGEGRRAFDARTNASFRLADTPRRWEGSDNVLIRYEVVVPRAV